MYNKSVELTSGIVNFISFKNHRNLAAPYIAQTARNVTANDSKTQQIIHSISMSNVPQQLSQK